MSEIQKQLPAARASVDPKGAAAPHARAAQVRFRRDEEASDEAAIDTTGEVVPAESTGARVDPGVVANAESTPGTLEGASAEPGALSAADEQADRHDRSSALLAAGLGLLGVGGAASLGGIASSSGPKPVAVVDPPKTDQPKSDPPTNEQKPGSGTSQPPQSGGDQGSTPDQGKPDQPKPDQPKPDQPKPDEPKPDQPKPDQPTPDDPKTDPNKPGTDPSQPDDPPPKPVHVPDAPTLTLQKDTGSNDHDFITASGLVNVSGLETGAGVLASLDDGKTWLSGLGSVLPESLFGEDGAKHLQVKQVDAEGHASAVARLDFQLDRTAPAALSWAMPAGKPALGLADFIALQGVEPGALVEYRLDARSPWQVAPDGKIPVSIFHADGIGQVEVRQTDLAGNIGPAAAVLATVDVTAPAAPTLTVLGPTAVNQGGLTVAQKPDIQVSGLEAGNAGFYSLDQGRSWIAFSGDRLPASIFGTSSLGHEHQDVIVKQVDGAGNETLSDPLHFIFDNIAATLRWVAPFQSAPGGGAVFGPDGVPLRKAVLGREDLLDIYGIEPEGHQQFSVDGGAHWWTFSGSEVPVRALLDGRPDGDYTLMLRQTDLVGNVSVVSSRPISVDVHAPQQPALALRNDDGSSATDRVTSDGAITVKGSETGLNVQYRFSNESAWHDAGKMEGQELVLQNYNQYGRTGAMEVVVRLIDDVGNISATSSLAFTLNHAPL